jgi:hypothetical protein
MITVTTNLEGFLEHIIKSTANNILSADPETNKVADIVYISSEVNGIALRSFTAEPLRKIINTIL